MFAAASLRSMVSTRAAGTIPMSMRSPTVLTPLQDSSKKSSFGARSSLRRMARTTRTTGTARRSSGRDGASGGGSGGSLGWGAFSALGA